MSTHRILERMAACATILMMFGGAVAQTSGGSAAAGAVPGGNGMAAGMSAAADTENAASKLASADRKMMGDIAHANVSEIAAGKLALEKSQSEGVRSFAQTGSSGTMGGNGAGAMGTATPGAATGGTTGGASC